MPKPPKKSYDSRNWEEIKKKVIIETPAHPVPYFILNPPDISLLNRIHFIRFNPADIPKHKAGNLMIHVKEKLRLSGRQLYGKDFNKIQIKIHDVYNLEIKGCTRTELNAVWAKTLPQLKSSKESRKGEKKLKSNVDSTQASVSEEASEELDYSELQEWLTSIPDPKSAEAIHNEASKILQEKKIAANPNHPESQSNSSERSSQFIFTPSIAQTNSSTLFSSGNRPISQPHRVLLLNWHEIIKKINVLIYNDPYQCCIKLNFNQINAPIEVMDILVSNVIGKFQDSTYEKFGASYEQYIEVYLQQDFNVLIYNCAEHEFETIWDLTLQKLLSEPSPTYRP